MVVSHQYLLSELESHASLCSEKMGKIDSMLESLHKQAVGIEIQIDSAVEILIDALQKRKGDLQETLRNILAKEHAVLTAKKIFISEHLNDLYNLQKQGSEDVSQFRRCYDNLVDKFQSFFINTDDENKLYFHDTGNNVLEEIMQFGKIHVQAEKLKDAMSSCSGFSTPDDFDILLKPENDSRKVTGESICEATGGFGDDKSLCQFSECCNCIDLCEELGWPLDSVQRSQTSQDRNFESWLLRPEPKEKQQTDGHSASVFDREESFGNRLAEYLEALSLCKIDGSSGAEFKGNDPAQLPNDLKFWLKEKKRPASVANDQIFMTKKEHHSQVSKKWDEIRAVPLSAWLKQAAKFEVKLNTNGTLHPNISQFEEISKMPLQFWLKEAPRMDCGVDLTPCKQEAVASVNEEEFILGKWLKRKHQENDLTESDLSETCKKIKSISLSDWLKTPLPEPNIGGGSTKAQLDELETERFRSTSTVQRFDDIIREYWEKQSLGSSFKMECRYSKWLANPSKSLVPNFVDGKANSVLKQFDEIAKSDLALWIKRSSASMKKPSHDLCKWLRCGGLKNCKECSFAF